MENQTAAYSSMTPQQRAAYQGTGRIIGGAILGVASLGLGGGIVGGTVGAVRAVTSGLTSAGLAFYAGLNASVAGSPPAPRKRVAPKTPVKKKPVVNRGGR